MNFLESVGGLVIGSLIFWLAYHLIKRLLEVLYFYDMQGKVIVITGCDSGFGRESATELVKKGCIVIAGCFLQESLTSLKDEVGALAHNMETVRLDLSNDDSVDEFVAFIKKFLKDNNLVLHGLVNNAGIFAAGASEWMSKETMRRVFAVNTIAPMDLSNRMAPLLHRPINQPGGRMVSISSVSAIVHGPMLSVYGASKAAMDNFQSAMRVETQRNFSVHLIMPGGFKTPLLSPDILRRNLQSHWESSPENVRRDYGETFFRTFANNWTTGVVKFADNNPSKVVDNIVHALFAVHPRDRYYTGHDARIIFSILSFAPTWFQDKFLRFANARFFKSESGRVQMDRPQGE